MACGQLHQGDVGSIFRVRVVECGTPIDVSTAATKTLTLQRPSGTVSDHEMLFQTDGADGVLVYATQTGDLDEAGPWTGQVFLVLPNGRWHTDSFSFEVGEVLSDIAPPPDYVPPPVFMHIQPPAPKLILPAPKVAIRR